MTPQPQPLAEIVGGLTPSPDLDEDRRGQSDRRQQPTSPWGAFPPAGRRAKMRRAAERRLPHFTDRFSSAMLVCILALIVASLADAGLTVFILHRGGAEVNPLMSTLLDHGISTFVIGKYALTVAGLPFLLIFRNHYLFGTRLRIAYLIPFCVALYAVLIGYQLTLISHHIGW
jgi:hypothetical protein